jgi:hypothetical protein
MKKPASSIHVSDSRAQRDAESCMLASLAERLKLNIITNAERVVELRGLKPDAIDWKQQVIVEVYARIGKLKGAQPHKVKGDILKLVLLERILGGKWRKVLCFADETAANVARGKSWVALAAKEFGVEVIVERMPTAVAARVRAAQHNQRMVNPA